MKPSHYKNDVIAELAAIDPDIAIKFCLGNIKKYAERMGKKANEPWYIDADKMLDYAARLNELLAGQSMTERYSGKSAELLNKAADLINEVESYKGKATEEIKSTYTPLTPLLDNVTPPEGCYQLGNDEVIKVGDWFYSVIHKSFLDVIESGNRSVSYFPSGIVFRPYPSGVTDDTRPTADPMPVGYKRVQFGMAIPPREVSLVWSYGQGPWEKNSSDSHAGKKFDDTWHPICVPVHYPLKPYSVYAEMRYSPEVLTFEGKDYRIKLAGTILPTDCKLERKPYTLAPQMVEVGSDLTYTDVANSPNVIYTPVENI